jgi:hypothetical protein
MENLTIDQRVSKIMELAGDDIAVAANLHIHSQGVTIPAGKRGVFFQNNIQGHHIENGTLEQD